MSSISPNVLSSSEDKWVADEIPQANETYVTKRGAKLNLEEIGPQPTKKVALICCMDARIDAFSAFGFQEGEAHIIRNGGGRASDSIRSLVISQQQLGTNEIILMHHTDCGFFTFAEDEFRSTLKSRGFPGPDVDAMSFMPMSSKDIDENVKADVEYLKGHPLIKKESKVSGWVHDLKDGGIRRVV
ncbi:uncharacterized protein I303_107393 [Kwoniella dejecticola CBS 10117]|uniref:Carbonic anhydrase n=1 Tax=Kwoniella dejecticola CBS 10117 TaxID=1296121 RepID=A0A1A5ZZJ9_9TREE|nr:uncharacterized protein I303_06797 [Kwoniella dejecticola CBS 10117]OBR83236.1 hypothetical protein I303_06797 [Kwoniella dejecticola CBS 10117]